MCKAGDNVRAFREPFFTMSQNCNDLKVGWAASGSSQHDVHLHNTRLVPAVAQVSVLIRVPYGGLQFSRLAGVHSTLSGEVVATQTRRLWRKS